ncbi:MULTISPECIES: hypothetical protein [Ralstonia solanacearum species complex]|uniref:hypothetical protein n=1 Tax=Ralstonia solanacearum species complex TaxID=3116862 RepID=UPI000A653244|nr:hypothetical protein [Ralstonia solanacearum]MDN4066189.1 hypothetical protein [Ralstonia solanacearum]NUU73694.1 hypothetical protein [Ralstonia solanacearum]QHB58409.1 hypothetical protein GRD98_04475 [Ralstonia solanacearum]
MKFQYDKTIITTQSDLQVSVADLRDLVQAFTIPNEAQRVQEIQLILESVVRKNGLQPGALGVE